MEAVKKAHDHATVTDTVCLSLSDSVTESESVSVTSVRAMCLYLDNHSISTISENELVYLPSGDTDRPNTDSAGLRSVEAPGQQCYRKVVDVMSIST